ncbi:hypothetical protein DNTS_031659 [Danionella cerebrum]|uniref:non-specific serine/threonine protein kinase n=1 Tax=Danionella cerebrum TaxID=2873325 RepID=A0A553PVP6_9TELE|nr:hypothetical protein DNTS_031659 [Danionella translucida]
MISAASDVGAKELLGEQIRSVLYTPGPSSSSSSEDASSSSAQGSASLCRVASLSSLQLRDGNTLLYEVKSCRYVIGKKLNERDHAGVFKGVRREDNTKIALKVSCKANIIYSRIEGHSEAVPLEIKLLTLANQKPRIPQIAELLDWRPDTDDYTMVLERPSFCTYSPPIGKSGPTMTSPKVKRPECCELLCSLLRRNQRKHLHMIKVCQHNWFKALYYEQDGPEIIEINSCSYKVILKIGNGGFGSIFKAVALKVADRTDIEYMRMEDHSDPVPSEVALQILANKGPRAPQILQLLDWELKSDRYIMVLDCPPFSENLSLQSDFHLFLSGTRDYTPPEFKENGNYYGKPATVWSLWILLFFLVTGEYPSPTDLKRLAENSWTYFDYSNECCKHLCSLLERDPEKRCELQNISDHAW